VEALPPDLAAPFWREAQAQAAAFLGQCQTQCHHNDDEEASYS
jgi:hypothetical protein